MLMCTSILFTSFMSPGVSGSRKGLTRLLRVANSLNSIGETLYKQVVHRSKQV